MRVPVDLSPGLISDDTSFADKATYKAADKVRYNKGRAEVIGGWERILNQVIVGSCRNFLPWRDNIGANMLAFGTSSKLYIYRGGKFADITPSTSTSYAAVPIANSGVNYDANTIVTFPAAPAGYTTATGNAVIDNGNVIAVTIDNYGAYPASTVLTAPTIADPIGNGITQIGNGVTFANVVAVPGYTTGNVDGLGGQGWGYGGWGKGGYGVSDTPGNYGPRTWALSNFGQALIANPRLGGIYLWGLDNVTDLTQAAIPVANLPGADGYCPLQCAYALVTPQRSIIALGATQVDGAYNPLCIRISDEDGNITTWLPATSNAADEVILPSGGAIIAGRYFGSLLAVFTQSNMYAGQFVGSPTQTMDFDPVDGSVGLVGPNAACVVGQTIFWLSPDLQLYSCPEGGSPLRVECPIRTDTLANVAPAQTDKIVMSYVAAFDEIRIDYPDVRDGLENSRYLTLQLESGSWSQGIMSRSAFDRGAPYQWPMGVETETLSLPYQGPITDNASAATALSAVQANMSGINGTNLVVEANATVSVGSPAITSIVTGQSGWGLRYVGNGSAEQVEIGGLGLTAGQSISVSYKAQMIVGHPANATVTVAATANAVSPDFTTSAVSLGTSQVLYSHQNIKVSNAEVNLFIGFPSGALANGAVVEVTDIKVEVGSMATGWTPAPNDPNLFTKFTGFISGLTYPQLTSVPYYHEQGNTADGDELDWSIETNDFALDEDQTAMLLRGFIPDFKGQLGNAAVTVYLRMNPQDLTEQVFGPYPIMPGMDRIDFMATGKIARFRVSGSGAPAFIRFGHCIFDLVPAGTR